MAAWVEANPLSNHIFVSRAPSEHLRDLTKGYDSGLKSIAADVQDQVVELNDRLSIQTSLLPRQIRWQAELAVLEMSDPKSIDRMFQATYQGGKGVIAAERDTMVSILGAEREAHGSPHRDRHRGRAGAGAGDLGLHHQDTRGGSVERRAERALRGTTPVLRSRVSSG